MAVLKQDLLCIPLFWHPLIIIWSKQLLKLVQKYLQLRLTEQLLSVVIFEHINPVVVMLEESESIDFFQRLDFISQCSLTLTEPSEHDKHTMKWVLLFESSLNLNIAAHLSGTLEIAVQTTSTLMSPHYFSGAGPSFPEFSDIPSIRKFFTS